LNYFVLESSLCSSWTSIHGLDDLNNIYCLFIMDSNTNNTDNLQEIVNRNEKVFSTENLNYLYPNGHRITHQMRWFKGSRDRCLRSDIAA
jgi:hypothetical protein